MTFIRKKLSMAVILLVAVCFMSCASFVFAAPITAAASDLSAETHVIRLAEVHNSHPMSEEDLVELQAMRSEQWNARNTHPLFGDMTDGNHDCVAPYYNSNTGLWER